jgi:hypothetical protein
MNKTKSGFIFRIATLLTLAMTCKSACALPANPLTTVCGLFFRKMARQNQKRQNLAFGDQTNEISILWYPRSDLFSLGHTELAVGMNRYDLTAFISRPRSLEAARRNIELGGKGYVSFTLKISAAEYENLVSYLNTNLNKPMYRMCTGGVCQVLREKTNIDIPYPFSLSPSLNAAYLGLAKLMGSKRVTAYEFVGLRIKDNLFSKGYYLENMAVIGGPSIAGYVVFRFLIESGEWIGAIIPLVIFNDNTESEEDQPDTRGDFSEDESSPISLR